MLRLTIVCSAVTICAAATTGSMPRCGMAPCAPLPLIVISKLVGRRHHRAGADRELARPACPASCACRRPLDREALEQALLDHRLGAALVLLGRLEDEVDGAVEVARSPPGSSPRRAAWWCGRHGRRHASCRGLCERMREVVLLLDWQRVHVGAEADRAARRRRRPFSVPTTPVPPRPRCTSMPQASQLRRDDARRCGAPRTPSRDGRGGRAARRSSRRGNRRCG